MRIVISTIPQSDQRYGTVGDYQRLDGNEWHIRVSETGDWRFNLMIGLHELVEVMLCHKEGITDEQIDQWDFAFQPTERYDEPGDHPDAPYFKQHRRAELLERFLANWLGVDWKDYERRINSLMYTPRNLG